MSTNDNKNNLKKRLIPVVLLRNGVAVQSKGFRRYQVLGNPITIVERLSDWASDELIYLDISRNDFYDIGRDDLAVENKRNIISILKEMSSKCFMPLSFGGGIRTLNDCEERLKFGADKLILNTAVIKEPDFINTLANEYGSQCIVICIDAKKNVNNTWSVYDHSSKKLLNLNAESWARELELRGAGEILIQSVDQDGLGKGYDLELIKLISNSVTIPVIALGGVGDWQHLVKGITEGGADAVAAANIFNFSENSVYNAKQHMFEAGLNVREPLLGFFF